MRCDLWRWPMSFRRRVHPNPVTAKRIGDFNKLLEILLPKKRIRTSSVGLVDVSRQRNLIRAYELRGRPRAQRSDCWACVLLNMMRGVNTVPGSTEHNRCMIIPMLFCTGSQNATVSVCDATRLGGSGAGPPDHRPLWSPSHFEAFGAARIASIENRALGVGIERPRHDDLPVFPF